MGAFLLDGQGVHIEAQQHGGAGARALQQGDHAGLADAGLHFQTQAGEAFGDDGGRARLLEAEFRVAVQVAADAYQVVGEGGGLLFEVERCTIHEDAGNLTFAIIIGSKN